MNELAIVRRKFEALSSILGERARRLWVGAEAEAFGHGGIKLVARATGMAISTVTLGRNEVRAGAPAGDVVNERRRGAGRPRLETKFPTLKAALEKLISPTTRGDPESTLRWTLKSTRVLSRELTSMGLRVSAQKVSELLADLGYSLQGTSRVKEGKQHPDRDAQFGHIKARTELHIQAGEPVISVDAKKKERIGEFGRAGREWQPKGTPVQVGTYDFFQEGGGPKTMSTPFGIYDIAANNGFINVGVDHDTPRFATQSIQKWWDQMGREKYPSATRLFITADSGGSNSAVSRVWKMQLQEFADRTRLEIEVSHFPPGTSKWNKIEHRLFSFVTLNWRGKPLTSYETIVALIGATKTEKGLAVRAALDEGRYPLGEKVPKYRLRTLALERAEFRGNWNYVLKPRSPAQIEAAAATLSPRKHTRAKWIAAVQEQIDSGLDSTAFCRERGISYDAFIQARRKLKGKIPRPPRPKRVLQAPLKKARWEQLVKEQIASKLSSAAFCRARGISYDTFIPIRRRLEGKVFPKHRPTSR